MNDSLIDTFTLLTGGALIVALLLMILFTLRALSRECEQGRDKLVERLSELLRRHRAQRHEQAAGLLGAQRDRALDRLESTLEALDHRQALRHDALARAVRQPRDGDPPDA